MDPLEVLFLVSCGSSFLVAVAIYMINPGRMINRSCVIALCLFALWCLSVFMAIHVGGQAQRYSRSLLLFWLKAANTAAAFLPWGLYLIKESILSAGPAKKILLRSIPWAAASLGLSVLAFSEWFLPKDNASSLANRGPGYMVYLVSMFTLSAAVLFSSMRGLKRCEGIARIELKVFAINFSLTTLVVLGVVILNTFLKSQLLRYVGSVAMFTSVFPALLIICSHKIFDAEQVMRTLLRRLIGLLLLAACATVILVATKPLMAASYGLYCAVIAVSLLAPDLDRVTRKWMQRKAINAARQSREEIIHLARNEPDENKLIRLFEQHLAKWNQTERVTLLLSRGDSFNGNSLSIPMSWPGASLLTHEGWITPESVARRRKRPGSEACSEFMTAHDLGALVAVPHDSPKPSMVIVLGRKPSLRPFTYPDIQLLIEQAELMENVLMHARIAARVAQIERMESAAMMSRSLAHDLNNLATPVSTFLLHMESRVQAGTTEAEVLSDAKHSLRVMQDYIRESLFFARRLVPDIRATSSSALLSSTMKVTQARASARGVTVQVESGSDISFAADPTLLQRLLQNLVLNGIDATPRGGRVTLSAAQVGNDRVRFRIEDEGPGVPAELREKIFEPYFTTKDTGDKVRGLGLGLAVSKKIADLHGGVIQIDRAASGGASFSVLFPLRAPGAR